MQRQLMFKLDQNPTGRGLRCDSDGLFLGRDALLQRNEEGNFEARPAAELHGAFARVYSDETDWESRVRSVKLVASALNKGEMARAMMTAVLMRLPDPEDHVRIADARGVLVKAGFNPDEPRDERGRWTNGGNSGNVEANAADYAGFRLADAGMSDASNDPVAQAAARAAAVGRHDHGSDGSRDKSVSGESGRSSQTFGTDLSDDVEALLWEIGRAQLSESNADRAVADAEGNAIAEAYDAYSSFMEQPRGGSVPITPEFQIWGYGDNARLAPERPITTGDAVAAAGSILSALPFGEAAEVSEFTASDIQAFIIRPLELPANFDNALPIGRYVIPTNAAPGTTTYGNLVHEQIGKLVQDAFPDVEMILRTSPGMKGVDIEILSDEVSDVGFQFAEIKPVTDGGFRTFNTQIARWKLPSPVQVISYDYEGNIYYGFPR